MGSVPHPLVPRRFRFDIETAIGAGSRSEDRHHVRTSQQRTTPRHPQLIAAIEADPGQPSMPWRRSSGPLFMPVNASTRNA